MVDALQTPVIFLIFNRPDDTARVFEAIRQARPTILLVAADGARPDRPGEAEQCAATRAIIDQVDWPCQVLTNFADSNMGMKQRVSSALNWAFGQVEEAIILEDDCLPHPTFFRFCEEMLAYYRHDTRVMTISGDNTPAGFKQWRSPETSYHFSIYPRIWGWATWRRAWKLFDVDMTLWPQVDQGHWLQDILRDNRAIKDWQPRLQLNHERGRAWACQWVFTSWLQHGLTVVPKVNLISNIGFDLGASHTNDLHNLRNAAAVEAMTFPLVHPPFMVPDRLADRFTQENVYDFNLRTRIQRRLRLLMKMLRLS
jgi:hypothetical protein